MTSIHAVGHVVVRGPVAPRTDERAHRVVVRDGPPAARRRQAYHGQAADHRAFVPPTGAAFVTGDLGVSPDGAPS